MLNNRLEVKAHVGNRSRGVISLQERFHLSDNIRPIHCVTTPMNTIASSRRYVRATFDKLESPAFYMLIGTSCTESIINEMVTHELEEGDRAYMHGISALSADMMHIREWRTGHAGIFSRNRKSLNNLERTTRISNESFSLC